MDAYESVLLVKNEVFVFKIPPLTTNRGHKAADWNLNEPEWTGRMRLVAKGNECVLKLEDKTKGELFAQCPIEKYPSIAIEPVADSSRYFVLRIQDDNGKGRSAFIGLGFSDRSDSFDLNVALQDHFNWVKKSEEIEKEKDVPKPGLDLSFKEGETIKINMKITKKDGSEAAAKPKARPPSGGSLLPPPPGGVKIAPPPAPSVNSSPSHQAPNKPESWGEFASASSTTEGAATATATATTPSNPNWVQF